MTQGDIRKPVVIDAAPFPKRIGSSVSFFKDGYCIGYSPTA